jgi:hypothetical protein
MTILFLSVKQSTVNGHKSFQESREERKEVKIVFKVKELLR